MQQGNRRKRRSLVWLETPSLNEEQSASRKLKIDSDGGERFIVWPTLSRTAEERERERERERQTDREVSNAYFLLTLLTSQIKIHIQFISNIHVCLSVLYLLCKLQIV